MRRRSTAGPRSLPPPAAVCESIAAAIDSGQYLLIECPDFHIGSHTETVLRRLRPPELCPSRPTPNATALSITGGFGAAARAASMRPMERGLVHTVASDAHDPADRHPRLLQARHAIGSRFGEDAAEILFLAGSGSLVSVLETVRLISVRMSLSETWS